MRQSSEKIEELLNRISFKVGDREGLAGITEVYPEQPFNDDRIAFLDYVSKSLLKKPSAKQYPDIMTFAFWIRKASMMKEKEKRERNAQESVLLSGQGTVFHISPSNVAVNFAYSFVAGFISGNSNIVRLPSKEFEQIDIISEAFDDALEQMPKYKKSVFFIRYGRDREINDYLSSFSDVRMIWGGDGTIAQLKESPTPARAFDITFADRYSLALIDSRYYLDNVREDAGFAKRTARDFYNDTYLTDQNACTSPRLILWTGEDREVDEASGMFWDMMKKEVHSSYGFQEIRGTDKLTNLLLAATETDDIKLVSDKDSMLYRVKIKKPDKKIMDYRGNSGFFYEYHMKDIFEIRDFCDKRVQTLTYIADKSTVTGMVRDLVLKAGVYGIDRLAPVGYSLDFNLVWDGRDLVDQMTRKITAF